MTSTEEMADYVVSADYTDIPSAITGKAKACILDSIGVALYGSRFEASNIAFSVLGEVMQRQGRASVLGKRAKCFPPLAAFVNGVMAHVADYDDILPALKGHASCVLMPAALAACETSGGSGKDLVTAFVVGTEVGGKLGKIVGSAHSKLGWHCTGTMGSLAAAAAAAKALKLDRTKVSNAIGIAASGSSGLRINFGTMTKSFHAGHAAMAGVLAAQLAEKGFDASPYAIEDEQGFAKVFGYRGEIPSVREILGRDYALDGIMLKAYPSCGGTHAAIDAMLKVRDQLKAKLEDIMEIEIGVSSALLNWVFYHNPETSLQCKFSIEFCAAAALIFGQVQIAQFDDKCVSNNDIRVLMRKIKVRQDGEMERASQERGIVGGVCAKVRLRDGRELRETVWDVKGSGSNPMSQYDIREKFRICASYVLVESSVEKVLELVERLEYLTNISELTSILV